MSRRLPLYLLVDTADETAAKRAGRAIEILLEELRTSPQALDTSALSLITFSGEARQVGPLTELIKFQFAPDQLAAPSALRSGLTVLRDCLRREVRKATATEKPDYKGLAIIFSSEQLTDEFRTRADPDKQVSFLCVDCGSDFDFEALRTEFLRMIPSLFPHDDGSIRPDSLPLANAETPRLPPSPPTITFDGEVNAAPAESGVQYLPHRRPVYFLVHTSESMTGQPLEDANRVIQTSIDDLRTDPQMMEDGHVSVIVFGDGAKQIVPLTPVIELQVPQLPVSYRKNKKGGWSVLRQSIQRDVRETTAQTRGDWKPAVFLFTNGDLSDQFVTEAQTTLRTTYLDWICVVACGPDADLAVIRRISETCVLAASVTNHFMQQFFKIKS